MVGPELAGAATESEWLLGAGGSQAMQHERPVLC